MEDDLIKLKKNLEKRRMMMEVGVKCAYCNHKISCPNCSED